MLIPREVKKFEFYLLPLLILSSLAMGIWFSIFNLDVHHWGFIAGTAIDFIQGKHFFTETYIQYGIGQALLFRMIASWVSINYTTPGIFTSLIYASTLVLLFLGLRRITSSKISFLILFLAYLLHPYAIYPWPDYEAGFCLSLSAYFLLSPSREKSIHSFLPGLFLFLAFFFRSTYLFNILGGGLAYSVLCLFNRKLSSPKVWKNFLTFLIGVGFFLVVLFSFGVLDHWYQQALGSAASQYGVGLKSIYQLIQQVFLPEKPYLANNLVGTTVSLLFYISIWNLYRFVFSPKTNSDSNQNGIFVFLILVGMAGVVQGTVFFEIFRLQNSCIFLYFSLAIAIGQLDWRSFSLKFRTGASVFLAVYLLLLAMKFPYASTRFPLLSGPFQEYQESRITYFQGHRLLPRDREYYESLTLILCDGKSSILNYTMDSTIPYLCPEQRNGFGLAFFSESMLNQVAPEKLNLVKQGLYAPNEIIVTETPLAKPVQSEVAQVQLRELGKVNTLYLYKTFQN